MTRPLIYLSELDVLATVTTRTPTAEEVAGIVADLIAWNGDTAPDYQPTSDEIDAVLRLRGFRVLGKVQP